MKRQLIYHTQIDTSHKNSIHVEIARDEFKTSCQLDKVSRDGLTLSCDASTLSDLMPNKACVSPKDPICFQLSFKVPQKIEASGRVIFARRLSRNEFVMEIKFVELAEASSAYLDNFIDSLLKREFKHNQSQTEVETQSIKKTEHVDTKSDEVKMTYQKVA